MFDRIESVKHLIDTYECRSIVEIGAWKGTLTLGLLRRCPQIKCYWVVDWWNEAAYKNSPNDMMVLAGLEGEKAALELYRIAMRYEAARVLRLDSAMAAQLFDDESLDLVFIDGCHAYEAVKCDIAAWLPKVKSSGILSGHDYFQCNGVTQAVDELQQLGVEMKFLPDCQFVAMPEDRRLKVIWYARAGGVRLWPQ